MKRNAVLFALVFLLTFAFAQILRAQASQQAASGQFHKWWNDRHVGDPLDSKNAKKLPLIQVKGNKFVDPQGNPILFRGLSISDPDKIANEGRWNKQHFVKVKEMGTQVVRIPVHPIAWRERTPAKYLELLDQAVEWCTELGMYIIIDWHSIGNLKLGLFQDPMYNTSLTETFEFWRTMARHYRGHNTVAFYELFNEPTLFFGQLGSMSWDEWKKMNEDMISLIRAYDRETIPLVAGFDWAYDLTPLLINPVEAEGIGYVTHPYPHKRTKPWEPKWEENFGFAAGRFPILATEIGFTLGKSTLAENGEYGKAIISYLENKGIGWVGWVFDPEWHPALFESWDTYKLTESGEFFKQALQGKLKN
ncbi:MAG: glycoside hydrolase family 5 protein [candidate division KSB1 bacterium]|nr:glycoside hydrolase family 5 protein [candidate division KSB1 bacterium]MDZ7304181.1 glycoside hydrolase family 5 protein [candidate division KSB1 bacterium]MDZ7310653.1 glycoside hydrolase family 5 protein [candidate division KSB1 bacterium]